MNVPLQAVFAVGALFAIFSIIVWIAIFRWRIPGAYWREGLYSNDPRNFIQPSKLDKYRTLMRMYGVCLMAWVIVLLSWAASR